MRFVLPELHDTCDIARWVDASNVVKIANVQAPVDAPCQCHWCQQLVTLGLAVTAGTRDTPAPPITHDSGDHRGLEGDELVLPVAFVEDAWKKKKTSKLAAYSGDQKKKKKQTYTLLPCSSLYWLCSLN